MSDTNGDNELSSSCYDLECLSDMLGGVSLEGAMEWQEETKETPGGGGLKLTKLPFTYVSIPTNTHLGHHRLQIPQNAAQSEP
jgi:hypothetical protein